MHRALFVFAAVVLGGCGTPFIHTAAVPGRPVADPGLAGEWTSRGETTVHAAVVPGQEAGGYLVALTVHHAGEFKTALSLEMSLTEIDGTTYADLFLARAERDRLVGTYGFLAVPVHQVMKVERDGDDLRAWSFDAHWLEESARQGRIAQDRVAVGGSEIAIITAPAEDVRSLISRAAGRPEAFAPPIVFRRTR